MIRNATMKDFDAVQAVYAHARDFMAATGNPDQWGRTEPSAGTVRSHIEKGELYVLEDGDGIAGVFAFIPGADPTYAYIDGAWRSDAPYAAIHCVASNGRVRGMFAQLLEFCRQRSGHLRIDTYKDNHIMQKVVTKHGFRYCGTIYLANGNPRMAYDYLV